MRPITLHIILLVFTCLSFQLIAQNNTIKGYRIDGEEVVFVFNKKEYDKISHDQSGEKIAFKNLDIKNVVVSGTFNDWSKNKWHMTKIDDNTYELRKKISQFSSAFSWEFKFVINNKYWVEPSYTTSNIKKSTLHAGQLDVYNYKMYTKAYPDKKGNVRFRLKGYKKAKQVIVSGSFNKWSQDLFKMYRIDKGWEIILKLSPDQYQYRFIVDGKWMEDPTNIDKVPNEFGEYNSRINVKKQITFKLNGYKNAKNVVLTGSFNNWNAQDYPMQKTSSGYALTIPLSGGKHHYKFIVDGKWIEDPNNTVKEYDYHGNINSVCMVQ